MSTFTTGDVRGRNLEVEVGDDGTTHEMSTLSAVVFEGVPELEVMSQASSNPNVAAANESSGEDNVVVVEQQPATVSVRCSSLGENGEMVINTIEVSTEELMSMGQMNAVEFVYSDSPNVNHVGENDEESEMREQEEASGTLEMVECDAGIASRMRIMEHEPRLVVQQHVSSSAEDTSVQEGSTEEINAQEGQGCSVPVDEEGQHVTPTSIIDLSHTTIDGTNIILHSCDETVMSNKPLTHHVDDSTSTNMHPNFIFTSDMQGLEKQIPVIIKTATLAQQTVTAAMTQPLEENRAKERSSLTLKVEVSEGTSVQLQKYYFQPNLCRVCLLAKENFTPIFEDVSIDSKGLIENSRGPNAANKFHLYTVLSTFFEIEVKYNDGLPQVICMDCYDQVMNFSVYRKRIAIGQTKLNQILEQVEDTNAPTFIPPIGEPDIQKTDVYKNPSSIIIANKLLKRSQYSHLVVRNLSDRLWDQIFISMSSIVGYKSGKLKSLEHFSCETPHVSGFFCYTCNSTIHGSKEDFAQHHYDCHGVISAEDVLYPCDICGNSYPLKDCTGESQNYAEHWLQHFFLHACPFCDKCMPSAKGLWIHKKNAHSRKEKIFACEEEGCHKVFSKMAHLDLHKRSHRVDSASLENDKKIHNCNECNKTFKTPSSLSTHVSTTHGTERPWKCDIDDCQKRFKRKEVLMTHKQTVHLNIRKFECEICKDRFKSHSSKTVHMLRHKGERNYTCSSCSQQFFTSNGLKSHMVKHQDVGTFPCDLCSKVFKRVAYLEDHKRTHTGETPFQCPVCDRAFRMKSNYFKHMRIHKRKNEVQ